MKLSRSFFAAFLLVLFCAPYSDAQTATIDWNNTHQVIDGFGAATGGSNDGRYSGSSTFTSEQASFFFSTSSGIGLSLLRTAVPDDGSCTTVNAMCAGQVSSMQLATAHGATIWSSPWSPPASMKTNGSTICDTGTGVSSLNSDSYSSYAQYLVNYVKSLSSLYGITLYALSVQNEPNTCFGYDGAIWSAANLDTFIKSDLGPAFVSAGVSSTLIMTPESSRYDSLASLAGTTMRDAPAAAYVGINAWHDYDAAPSVINPYASQNKLYWETEASAGPGYGPSLCEGCWDPSMADALMWAQIVDNRLAVANANAWNYWKLIDYAGNKDNEGLVGFDGTISKRAYMLGNYSKFIRPGYVRIDATHTPQTGLTISAYKDASTGSFAIVVTNQNSSNVSQIFKLNGFTAAMVTPEITSASLNLAEQSSVPITGATFSYTLSATSVTTFVGVSTGNPPSLNAPTNLTATVR
jgi:glucuronoarabinoxylan endo-1,4-beta-xylanase